MSRHGEVEQQPMRTLQLHLPDARQVSDELQIDLLARNQFKEEVIAVYVQLLGYVRNDQNCDLVAQVRCVPAFGGDLPELD